MPRRIIVILLIPLYVTLTGCAAILDLLDEAPVSSAAPTLAQEVIIAPSTPVDDAAAAELETVLRARLDALRLSTYELVVDEGSFVVRLPSDADFDLVMTTLTQDALLEFVDFSGLSAVESDALLGQSIVTSEGGGDGAVNPSTGEPFATVLTGDSVVQAAAELDTITETWIIFFELDASGGERLEAYTTANTGEPLAIVLDGVVLSAPTIQGVLRTEGVITGNFTEAEARSLAAQLNSDPLLTPLEILSVAVLPAP